MEWLSETLSLATAVVALIAGFVGFFLKSLVAKITRRQEIVDEVTLIVNATRDQYIEFWRDAVQDGKISKEESEQAIRLARDFATKLANGPLAGLIRERTLNSGE